MNFGLQGGRSIEEAAVTAGVNAAWAGRPVLVVVLWGGFALAALAGVIWVCQFACQKIGEQAMGEMRYISFAVVMGSFVLFSSLLGACLGEWKGTRARTRLVLLSGLLVLVLFRHPPEPPVRSDPLHITLFGPPGVYPFFWSGTAPHPRE